MTLLLSVRGFFFRPLTLPTTGWVSSSLPLVVCTIWAVSTFSVFLLHSLCCLYVVQVPLSAYRWHWKERVRGQLLLWTEGDVCPQSSPINLKMLERFLNMSPVVVQGCCCFSGKKALWRPLAQSVIWLMFTKVTVLLKFSWTWITISSSFQYWTSCILIIMSCEQKLLISGHRTHVIIGLHACSVHRPETQNTLCSFCCSFTVIKIMQACEQTSSIKD